ncbi:MAG: DUF4097 family beta strand repeat-containing protein [Planctomycetota bacterium]|nr:DUF4097 family beta strand repeat-containing protein [Planctomycetota bacterium]
MRTFARVWMAGLLAVGGAGLLAGTPGCGVFSPATIRGTKTAQAPHVPGSGLDIATSNGSVTVTVAPGEEVQITAEIRALSQARLDATMLGVERSDDGTLSVRVQWPEGRRHSNEGCSIDLRVPDASGVVVDTGNGSITLAGAAGQATLSTSNGSITVSDHSGPVSATTSNGSVNLRDVGTVRAKSSNGRITVVLRNDVAGPVHCDTSNGSITLEFGTAFDALVDADTSNGGVTVAGPSLQVVKSGKSSGSFKFGAGTHPSRLDTSNGSITIRPR